jgi:lipoprotein-anchoring transpeptidase ErfK/SrfK
MPNRRLYVSATALLLVAACNPPQNRNEAVPPSGALSAPAAGANTAAVVPTAPTITASANPQAQAIDHAEFIGSPAAKTSPSGMNKTDVKLAVNGQAPGVDQSAAAQQQRVLIKAQVLLDRAHFGPGSIDGKDGQNFGEAVSAFEAAHGLNPDGKLDAEVWRQLTQDTQPIMQDYVITDEDVKGPFLDKLPAPNDYKALAALDHISYTSPLEGLAEKFHMDPALLKALNPDANFSKAGTTILVTAPNGAPLPVVDRVEVDKAKEQLRAYDASNKLVAVYPATVGSAEMPTPAGEYEVTTVQKDPVWNYDPSQLHFGDRKLGKLTIKSGPNNPVGAVWIDLSKPTYGIHGTPDPEKIGKTASHGCVRLTNWDALALGAAVHKGTKVAFTGPGNPDNKKKS